MHSSIRESKDSLFSYGHEGAVNHRVSLYVAGVCACLLFFITIVLVCIPQDLYSTNTPACNCTSTPQQACGCDDAKMSHAMPAPSIKPQCSIVVADNNDCQVTCEDIGVFESGQQPGQVAAANIKNFYQNYSDVCSGWKLLIKSSKFPNDKVAKDWFEVDDENNFPPIKILELQSCFNLKMIEEGALEKFPFGLDLKSIILARNMEFTAIKSDAFKGLLALQEFNLRENGVITAVDGNIFDQFKSSFQVLQVQGGFANATLMAQMTGICQQNFLNRLVLVDMSFSNQGNGLWQLGSHQLSALRKVQSLYLHQSGIAVIDVDAFEHVSDSIGLLSLADNQLETLQNGVFDKIMQRSTRIEIYLAGNRWSCDCRLKWLQGLIEDRYSTIFIKDTPICHSPDSEKGKTLWTANMSSSCPQITPLPPQSIECPSNTPTSTTALLPSHSTSPPPQFHCDAFHPSLRRKFSTVGKSVRFTVREDAKSELEYAEVVVDTGEGVGRTLVWHRDDQPLSCYRGVTGPVVVKNLTRGVAYVFCLYEGENIESPSQCQGVKTQPSWAARAWIVNEQMPMWVSLFVVIAIACALVGAGSVICAFWQKPTLLALSSRVVKVRTSSTEAVVMPKKHKEQKIEQEADCASIRSDPSYVSVQRASKVSLFAFRFRAWLRKVENGEISAQPPGEPNFGYRGGAVNASIETVSSGCSHL